MELNAHLLRLCEAEMSRTVAGRARSIDEEFAIENQQALALLAHRFDACVTRPAVVDKYQTLLVGRCRYSAPRECAFKPVTVKLYAENTLRSCMLLLSTFPSPKVRENPFNPPNDILQ